MKNWQEAIGIYKGTSPRNNPVLRVKGEDVEVNVSGFPLSEQLKKQLNDLSPGDFIGIIRTDDSLGSLQPFLVRVLKRVKIEN
ncbi:MAG: hypothetical protein QXH37_01450 [Candidatus Bathyarchaeia archaeon]